MLIKSVAIKNFRCIKDLTVELDDLTAFVGRNGSGKSTTLHALNAFYDIRASITEHDFFNGDVSQSIEITVEYRDLSDEEVEAFSAHFNGESFAVTKVIRLEDGKLEQKYFAATRQIPQISKIKGLRTVTDKRNAWNDLVDTEALPGIGPKSQRGDDPGELMDSYEQEHPDLLEWVRQEVQFLGPANIGGGKLDKFTKFVYVPAVRDASDDSNDKKGSPLFQLMDYIVMRRFRARTDVRALQEDFSQRLAELYKPDKLTEYNELAAEISQTLQLYVPNAELRLRVTEPTLPDIPNPATFAELTEDEYSGSIDRKGHGLQRTLIFSLLQHLAVAVPIEPETEELEGEDVAPTELQASALSPDSRVGTQNAESSGPNLIVAIEEPELYQHPLRARHLAQILLKMSRESSMGPGGRNQIIYTTHSPYFVDLERFDQLRIMRKFKHNAEEPPCTDVSRFSLASASENMAELTGKPKEEFTADSFRARAYPVMTRTVNEGFFAEGVVLVEGDTEAAALTVVAQRMGSDWLSKGIAILTIGGKTKIDRAAVVFKGLGIPTYIVFDGDAKNRDTKHHESECGKNRLLLRLCGADEEDFPATIASDRHACFEEDFESYCRGVLGEEHYSTIREAVAASHGYSKPSDGIKNFDVVVDLVNGVYEAGYQLNLLEEIVDRVDQLVCQDTTHGVAPIDDLTEAMA